MNSAYKSAYQSAYKRVGKKVKNFLALMLSIFFGCTLQIMSSSGTERFKFERFSIDEGLSQSTVTSILMDRRGLMWFGTEEGVNRWDGYTFTIFKPEPNQPNSLSNTRVYSLFEDHEGVIWVGTLEGLNRFNRETETFTRFFFHDPGPSSDEIISSSIFAITEDTQGNLWIGTTKGLTRWNRQSNQFKTYYSKESDEYSLSSHSITSLYYDHRDTLWIGTREGGLNRYDRLNDRFIRYIHDPAQPGSLSHNRVRAITEDIQGNIWVGTDNGLNFLHQEPGKFEPGKFKPGKFKPGKFKPGEFKPGEFKPGEFKHYIHDPDNPYSISSNTVHALACLDTGELLVGTEIGLNLLQPDGKNFLNYHYFPQDPNSLSNNIIISIYQDPSGILWVGTEGGGFNKFSPVMMRFHHYRFITGEQGIGLSGKIVYNIFQDAQDILWVGTNHGLTRMERHDNQTTYTHYRSNPDQPGSLNNNTITCIHEDHQGVLWLGTWGGGLNRMNRKTGLFSYYQPIENDDTSLSHPIVRVIYEDQNQSLWIGTNGGGLNRFNRDTETFSRFMVQGKNIPGISNNNVYCLAEMPAGILWIGTMSGLTRFDTQNNQWRVYSRGKESEGYLSSAEISSLCASSSGNLWIGTYGCGLNKLELKSGKITHYRLAHGLPNEVIYAIQEDQQGHIWLSTNRGLSCFNPANLAIRNFNPHDGLQAQEFNLGSGFRSQRGELFFGGINGFNAFFPENIQDNSHQPAVVITDFKILNEPVTIQADGPLKKSILETKKIELSYRDYVFSFEFAALDYTYPEANRYAYMMEGLDQDWIYCGTRRSASYTTLAPGSYTFRVKACNNDGVWNETGTGIHLVITPPFYQTLWFRLSGIIILLLLVLGIYKLRTHAIRKQNKQLEEMNSRLNRQFNEKIEAEAQLQKSERRFRTFLQTAIEGFLEVDKDQNILDVNPEMCSILDRDREEIIGQNIIAYIHPRDIKVFNHHTKIREAGKKSSYNLTILKPNHELVHCLVNASPLFDDNQQVKGSFAMITDITDIVNAEEELKQTKNYLNDLFNSLSSILISLDLEWLITQWNNAAGEYFGIPAAKAISRKLWRVVPFLNTYRPRLEQVLSSRQPLELHRECVQFEEGEKKFLDLHISPLSYSGKQSEGLVIRIDDVTELERKDRQLLQAQKMEIVGNLAGGLAHDFNNVLGGIVGNISLMQYMFEKNSPVDIEKLKNRIDMMERESHRAVEMVKRLLTISRKNEPLLAQVNLNKVLEHIMKIGENTFDKSIRLDFTFSKKPAIVRGDVTQLEQVLLNLCVNASHAMTIMRKVNEPQGGTLSVSVEYFYADRSFIPNHPDAVEGHYWKMTVSDTGVGMDIKTLSRIFDPFFTTKTKDEGTGLGLAMVYNIVRQHQGFIDVYSQEGVGSTFKVFLPELLSAEPNIDESREQEETVHGSGLILIIDDEKAIRETAGEILELCGYQVIYAEDGQHGMDIYKKNRDQIKGVLLDMAMANMSGKETYIELKKINPDVKVLLSSGFKQDERVKEALNLGIKGFLQKPYSIGALSKKIAEILHS